MICPLWTIATSAKPVAQNGCARLGRDVGLGRESHVADSMGPLERDDVVDLVDVVGAADVLDDVEAFTDRSERGGVLHRVRELLQIAVEAHEVAHRRPDELLLDDLRGELAEPRPDVTQRALGDVAVADEEPQVVGPTAVRRVVEREAGRIGAAVLAAVEHRDEITTERVLRSVLVQDPGDPTHVSCRSRRSLDGSGEPVYGA